MSARSETWGFVGTGAITDAMITGLYHADIAPGRILVSRRSDAVSARLAAQHEAVEICETNQEIADQSDLIFLAVRPQVAEDILRAIRFRPEQEVASLIATLPTETLAHWIAPALRITRAVPTPPVAQGRGVTLLSGPSARLEHIFGAMGGAVVTEDPQAFDAYTLPSTMMGLYFGIQDSLLDSIVAQGGSRAEARRFLVAMFRTLAETAETDTTPLGDLRVEHSTPGGLNEQFHKVFVEEGGAQALDAALNAVAQRVARARASQ